MGKPYTVFIDESFDGFMNLSRDDGYFCYAALMVLSSLAMVPGFFVPCPVLIPAR